MFELLLRGLSVLAEVVLELVFGYLFYACGWLVLRLLTLGRYPRLPLRVADPLDPRSSWVSAFGIFCVVGLPLAFLVFSYG
jgi:predicted cobalt transporter CbtA